MKRKIGKMAVIALSLGMIVSVQQFSGSVFGESSVPIAFEKKLKMDQVLEKTLAAKPADPLLEAKLNAIFIAETNYKLRINACWQEAKLRFEALPVHEKSSDNLCDQKLMVRNQLLRESHVADAQMLPLFKALRQYLKDQNMDSSLASTVEQHYEATKKWLILIESPAEQF